jgi:transposase InsO family protein
MKAEDVTDTLQLALAASGCDQARVIHKPRLLSDNGSSYVSADLTEWLDDNGMRHVRGAPHHPQTQGKIERWQQTLKNRILLEIYYLPGDLEAHVGNFVEHYSPPLPRELEEPHARRCLLRQRPNHLVATRKDQTPNHPKTTIAAPNESRLNFKPDEPRASARSRQKLSQSIQRRTPVGVKIQWP